MTMPKREHEEAKELYERLRFGDENNQIEDIAAALNALELRTLERAMEVLTARKVPVPEYVTHHCCGSCLPCDKCDAIDHAESHNAIIDDDIKAISDLISPREGDKA